MNKVLSVLSVTAAALMTASTPSSAEQSDPESFMIAILDELCVELEANLPVAFPCNYRVGLQETTIVLQSPMDTETKQYLVHRTCTLANNYIYENLGVVRTNWKVMIHETEQNDVIGVCALDWLHRTPLGGHEIRDTKRPSG